MMFKWIKTVVALVLFFVSFQVMAQPIITGGEIPWPLAHQYKITAENSRGLWKLEQASGMKYYNVEILDEVNDMTFIRVSELDTETFKVISWGEGFFKETPQSQMGSDFWSIYLDGQIATPTGDVGQYLYMYPNGDLANNPYMLRLVEVRTVIGTSLGISIFQNSAVGGKEHVLGSRMQAEPLSCRIDEVIDSKVLDNLTCELPIDDSNVDDDQVRE